jgi:type I restriction enzyme, S subunit
MAENVKPTATPRLRFPEFREAEGWEKAELGSIATILKGRGLSKSDVIVDGARLCIRYGELYTRYSEVIDVVHSRTNAPAAELFLSRKNDVIIPASGETKLDIAKASCVLLDNVALGSDLNVLRIGHNGVFLSYLLNGSKRYEIARVAQGDTVVHLYPSQLQEITVATPLPAEQQKIADCLTSLDEVIAAQRRKVEALKSHKRGLMQQLFPREGETLPRLRFPEFRDKPQWEVKEVGDVFRVTRGEVLAMPLVKAQQSGETPYPVYSSQTKNSGLAGYYSDFLFEDAITWTTDGANAGEVNYRVGKFYCTNVCGVLLNTEGSANLCVAALLNTVTRSHVSYVGNPKLMNGVMAKIAIPFPNLAEQKRIADCLTSLDAQIAADAEKLDALKTHKKGLMQQLFPSPEGD